MYIIFGISEGEICYALTGVGMILLGALLIVVQPYKSTKVNTYHTILVLYVYQFLAYLSLHLTLL